jgi:hypothetical protein
MSMSKPDRDMGGEVDNLGGYRPTTDRLRPSPIVQQRYVEIVIVATPRATKPKPRHWYEKPFIKLGPT